MGLMHNTPMNSGFNLKSFLLHSFERHTDEFRTAMKLRRREYDSEDRLVKSRRCKGASKISVNGRVYLESIPIDLVIEILSRLPAKSIAECRCVSKLWASIPKMKTDILYSYFGYDPIEKQFKVLSVNGTALRGADNVSYQVMTLGTKEMSWRKVECCIPHFSGSSAICVNGVLYYQGYYSGGTMIVCFDIRSEKFCFLKVGNDITGTGAALINYNGKLGSLVPDQYPFSVSSGSLLWILEDTEKQEWSKHVHVLPPLWKDVVEGITILGVVGMVGGNELVFSSYTHSLPFYVFFYNMEQNTIRRVEIQGLKGWRGDKVQTFINHVEDINPIDGY